ncbi:MAG: zinc ribbon domain-containing protein [Ruminococcaceae bacterium]|nr:zinc ribbon domain-containing protein [Oscillospiraceae bacterium]
MFCVNCGVKLADTEKKCPLCGIEVYHPDLAQPEARPLYPKNNSPKPKPNSKALGGVVIILFLIPMLVTLLADLHNDLSLDWFGYVAGGIIVAYVALALPMWFRKPNPVIFLPCSFAAATVYLLYINLASGGTWFMSFAFPVMGALTLIFSATVALFKYVGRGKLYILGGTFIALGGVSLLIEFLLTLTFEIAFKGWSIYPLATLFLLGGLLIYLGINRSAREMMERKLFL